MLLKTFTAELKYKNFLAVKKESLFMGIFHDGKDWFDSARDLKSKEIKQNKNIMRSAIQNIVPSSVLSC